MAIEVKVNGEQEVKREYPYLGKLDEGDVVLFIRENTGVNVRCGVRVIAEYRTDWIESAFTPLSPSESITLSNKA